MNRWQIGDVTITRFVEMETLSKGTFVLPDATLENIQRAGEWLRPHFADENGRVRDEYSCLSGRIGRQAHYRRYLHWQRQAAQLPRLEHAANLFSR